MTDINKLNYLAQLVIECFKEAGLDDYYIQNKIEKLSKHGQNRYDTLLWCALSLDEQNTERLANKKNVSVEDLKTTFRTIRKIENC